MWQKYFKVKGIVPGPVVTRLFGQMDFSSPDLSLEKVQALYEADFPYLDITPEGKRELYGVQASPPPVASPAARRKNTSKPSSQRVKRT